MKNEKLTFEKYYYIAIGEIFTDLRQKSGRSFTDIAKLFNMEANTYYAFETGRRKMPLDLFMKLCNLYFLKPEDVLKDVNARATELLTKEIFK